MLVNLQTKTLDVLRKNKKGLSARQINKAVHTTEARKMISVLRENYRIDDFWKDGEADGRKVRYKIYVLVE